MNWTVDMRDGEWVAMRCSCVRFSGSYADACAYAITGRMLDP